MWTMRPNQSRTSGAIVLVSSLAVVLVRLAVLQYRWSGQVSQAERDRLQAGLQTAVGQFHDQFLRTLQQLCSSLQMNPALLEKQDWQLYARDCKGSLGGSSGRLLEQILQFARFQNGRDLQNCAPLEINESVDATLERTLPALIAAGFQVEKSLASDLPRVKADAAVLAQCIQSLLDNRMKYSGENRRLALRTGVASGRQGAEALITVEDKGIGINAEDLPHIFTPFYRGRTAAAAQIRGTGLGLSIANDSVAAMGGKISVTSAVGKGSSFTIHLPALPDNSQHEKVQHTNRRLLGMIHGTENSDH
jgi:signal transduction histidine kinase